MLSVTLHTKLQKWNYVLFLQYCTSLWSQDCAQWPDTSISSLRCIFVNITVKKLRLFLLFGYLTSNPNTTICFLFNFPSRLKLWRALLHCKPEPLLPPYSPHSSRLPLAPYSTAPRIKVVHYLMSDIATPTINHSDGRLNNSNKH